jgi:transcriptional regulator with XRE-family HTH domain
MARTFKRPFPSVEKQICALGERLKLARLRRELSTVLFAERLGISRDTLSRLEKGDPNIALGTYMRALRVLGLDKAASCRISSCGVSENRVRARPGPLLLKQRSRQ